MTNVYILTNRVREVLLGTMVRMAPLEPLERRGRLDARDCLEIWYYRHLVTFSTCCRSFELGYFELILLSTFVGNKVLPVHSYYYMHVELDFVVCLHVLARKL